MSKEIENKTTSISKDNKPLREKEVYFGSKDELNYMHNTKLSSLIKIHSGKDYKHLNNGNVPVYGSGGLMCFVDKPISDHEDAIGIGRKGSIEKIHKLKYPFWTVDTLFWCTSKGYNLSYLKYLIETINLKRYDEGSTLPSLSSANIKKIPISIHSENVVEKISAKLSQIDNLILNNSINQKSLNKLRKISLEQLMLKNTVDSVAFYELFEILEGLKGVNKENFEKSPNSCFISFKSIHSNNIYESTLENVYVDNFDMQNSVCYNDILITMSSENIEDIGIVSINKVKLKNLFLNSFSKILRVKNNYNPDYIYYLLKHSYYRKMIMNEGQGITRINLSINRISNIIIDLPNIEEQNKIANILSQMDKLIEIEEKKLEKLTEMKKYFLQQFFD